MAVVCEGIECEKLKQFLSLGLKFINLYKWLVDKYVLDFFVESHWKMLPSKWQKALEELAPVELGQWLSDGAAIQYKHVWPLSLLALRAASKSLSLPRKPIDGMSKVHDYLAKFGPTESQESESDTWGSASEELSMAAGQHTQLAHVFRRYVKPKKQHEIVRLAQVASNTAKTAGCNHILDVGSGLGHLARLLSYGHGLVVSCIDAQDNYINSARAFDSKLEETLKKQKNGECNNGKSHQPPSHLTLELSSNVEYENFHQILFEKSSSEDTFGIVGLHTCGNLGPTLLRLFVHCPKATMLNSVGCCYLKASTKSDGFNDFGYPMSRYMMQNPEADLSYEAREIACHAIEIYSQRLQDGNEDKLKVHAYRATLEKIILHRWPHLCHSGLRSVRNAHLMNFSTYAQEAVKKKLDVSLTQDDLCHPEVINCLQNWWKVVLFYSLRLLFAPVIETVLLIDRLIYLHENGIVGCLLPVFDPVLSPRNHLLIAVKKST